MNNNRIFLLYRFLIIIYQLNSRIIIWNLFLRIALACLPIISLWIGKLIIDAITINKDASFVFNLLALEAIIGAFILLGFRLIRFINENINQDFSINVTAKIIKHINTFSIEELENADFYNLLTRAVDETENASDLIEHFLDEIEETFSIVVYSVTIIVYNKWLILLFLLSQLPSVIGEYKFYLSFYKLRRSWTDKRREIDYLTWLSTTETNLKEIKIFQLGNLLVNRLTSKKRDYYKLLKKLRRNEAFFCGALSLISLSCYYLAYVYVVYDALSGLISIGTMVYLASALRNLNSLFSRLFSSFTWITHKVLYINDFFIFMDKKPREKVKGKRIKINKEIVNSIELKNVGFKYSKAKKWALRHINLKLEKGEKIAILGANGSGKTTLLKILTGLYQPTEGNILINGIDMTEIEDCKELFGIIFQDYIKYEFEVKENIGISDLDDLDNDSRIRKCAEKSGASDFIEHLPLRYQQVLSNRFQNGMQLSGGEWQKIAVARALFSNRPVLILDEPTASMDILSEKRLFENLLSNYANENEKIIIVVSHRLSQLKDIDRIIVIENGQIVEDGKHEDLLSNQKTYSKMYEAYINK